MQPARADVVQNLTLPSSVATTVAFLGARTSFPSWRPCGRGSPKSFVYRYGPTTGNTIGLGTPSCRSSDANAGPAARAAATMVRIPRAAVRRRFFGFRFACERPTLAALHDAFNPRVPGRRRLPAGGAGLRRRLTPLDGRMRRPRPRTRTRCTVLAAAAAAAAAGGASVASGAPRTRG